MRQDLRSEDGPPLSTPAFYSLTGHNEGLTSWLHKHNYVHAMFRGADRVACGGAVSTSSLAGSGCTGWWLCRVAGRICAGAADREPHVSPHACHPILAARIIYSGFL